jgi:hypothetical protein
MTDTEGPAAEVPVTEELGTQSVVTQGFGYNKGSIADRKKALDSINDYNKTLITLATGTVALSATFLGTSLYHGASLDSLIASWIVLGVSVFMGLLGLGSYVSQYAESEVKPRRSVLEVFSLLQVLALLAGLGLLGSFAIDNATHSQTAPSPVHPMPGSPCTGRPVPGGPAQPGAAQQKADHGGPHRHDAKGKCVPPIPRPAVPSP